MLKGWDNNVMFNLSVQRQLAIISAEVTNRTMGGKGVVDYVMKMFPLKDDAPKTEMTPEKITELIALYNARQAARRKKLDNNG
jgi:hypothetical protein